MRILLLLLFFGGTIYLNAQIINVPDDYEFIQDAIDNAQTGDTVLVSPGEYKQTFTIDKDITIASHYILSGDTSDVSSTILLEPSSNPNIPLINMNAGALIGLTFGDYTYLETPQSSICRFTKSEISNIRIENNIINATSFTTISGLYLDSLVLSNASFIENRMHNLGNYKLLNGDTYWYGSHSLINNEHYLAMSNSKIINNDANFIFSNNYPYIQIELQNVSIIGNTGYPFSVSCDAFSAENMKVINNGSISISVDSVRILNSKVAYNRSGLNLGARIVNMEGTSIHNNLGTGLRIYSTYEFYNIYPKINLSNENLNSIYDNRGTVRDLYISSADPFSSPVVLDTFSTEQNTFAYTFNLSQSEKTTIPVSANTYTTENINADLYVSPGGNDDNSGLNKDQPFRTINHALDVIYADTLNPKTIHLAAGTYSSSTNNETFPLIPSHAVSIIGDDPQNTIIEGDGNGPVFDIGNIWRELRSTGGIFATYYLVAFNQRLLLKNLTISGGLGDKLPRYDVDAPFQGGITIEDGSTVRFENCIITENTNAAIAVNTLSSPVFVNCTMVDSIAIGQGFTSGTRFINCLIDETFGPYGVDISKMFINTLKSIDPDTVLTDPQNGDYTLFKGSPAIDAGIAYYAEDSKVLIDLDSTQYAGSAPDLGALEFGYVSGISSNKEIPGAYFLAQNYPNPFNPQTTIRFYSPKSEHVVIEILNTLGQRIDLLLNKNLPEGEHFILFNGSNYSSGIYFYKMEAGEFISVKKMLLLK